MKEHKRILIVDDSEIDRLLLRNILENHFEVVDVENGYSAMEVLTASDISLDAILLDISMPYFNGFEVLENMQKNGLGNIPVMLITSEATKDNVYRAKDYGVTKFISKPFSPELVMDRLLSMLQLEADADECIPSNVLSPDAIREIDKAIQRLKRIYKKYLDNHNISDRHFQRVSKLMKILLKKYYLEDVWQTEVSYNKNNIDVISKAAYFYDIGMMGLPDPIVQEAGQESEHGELYRSHTVNGQNMVLYNSCSKCKFFVEVCSNLCAMHHERVDGNGYPRGLKGEKIPVYVQICSMILAFDRIFVHRISYDENQFEFCMNELAVDSGAFGKNLFDLFKECETKIIAVYRKEAQREENA